MRQSCSLSSCYICFLLCFEHFQNMGANSCNCISCSTLTSGLLLVTCFRIMRAFQVNIIPAHKPYKKHVQEHRQRFKSLSFWSAVQHEGQSFSRRKCSWQWHFRLWKKRKDLAAAKSSTDSSSTQSPLQSMWSSSFEEGHDFKEVITTGLSDNIWVSPWSYSAKQLGQTVLLKISLVQLKVKEWKHVGEMKQKRSRRI